MRCRKRCRTRQCVRCCFLYDSSSSDRRIFSIKCGRNPAYGTRWWAQYDGHEAFRRRCLHSNSGRASVMPSRSRYSWVRADETQTVWARGSSVFGKSMLRDAFFNAIICLCRMNSRRWRTMMIRDEVVDRAFSSDLARWLTNYCVHVATSRVLGSLRAHHMAYRNLGQAYLVPSTLSFALRMQHAACSRNAFRHDYYVGRQWHGAAERNRQTVHECVATCVIAGPALHRPRGLLVGAGSVCV